MGVHATQRRENQPMIYSAPGTEGSKVEVLAEYGNFIGGQFQAPIDGEYADNPTPVTGKPFTRYALSTEADVEAALDAAHSAAPAWGETSLAQRAIVLNKIADAVEEHLEEIAYTHLRAHETRHDL